MVHGGCPRLVASGYTQNARMECSCCVMSRWEARNKFLFRVASGRNRYQVEPHDALMSSLEERKASAAWQEGGLEASQQCPALDASPDVRTWQANQRRLIHRAFGAADRFRHWQALQKAKRDHFQDWPYTSSQSVAGTKL